MFPFICHATLISKQAGMEILETGDTALILDKTVVSANNAPIIERKAT